MSSRSSRPLRLARAVATVAEALERRVLLSVTPDQQFINTWDHLSAAARTDLAVLEYRYPQFADKLDAILGPLGLTPIAPQDGTLVQFPVETTKAKLAKVRHHKPPRHPKPRHHGKGGPTPPSVTGVTYAYDQALPNDLTFSLSEGVNVQNTSDWANTISVVNLDTGAVVPATAVNEPGVPQIVYHLNNSAELGDGNYAAILHGSYLLGLTSGLPVAGSPALRATTLRTIFSSAAAISTTTVSPTAPTCKRSFTI